MSVIFLFTAIITFENVMPVMIGTLSFSISLSTICVATSGLSWLSSLMISHRHAAQLAAVLLDDHHERVVLVLPQRALRPRQLGHEADLDRRLRVRRGCGGGDERRDYEMHGFHGFSSQKHVAAQFYPANPARGVPALAGRPAAAPRGRGARGRPAILRTSAPAP